MSAYGHEASCKREELAIFFACYLVKLIYDLLCVICDVIAVSERCYAHLTACIKLAAANLHQLRHRAAAIYLTAVVLVFSHAIPLLYLNDLILQYACRSIHLNCAADLLSDNGGANR